MKFNRHNNHAINMTTIKNKVDYQYGTNNYF